MTMQGGTQGKSEVKRQEVVKNIKCCSQIKKLLVSSNVVISSQICSSAVVRRDKADEFYVNKFIN